jgi:hypothetical protein
MLVTFGEHEGKSSEVVLLKHASYVKWVPASLTPVAGLRRFAQICSACQEVRCEAAGEAMCPLP